MKYRSVIGLFTGRRTSIIRATICAAVFVGCYDASMPPTEPISVPGPVHPPSTVGSIAGFVYDESHSCIVGSRVEIMDGPQKGAAYTQTFCDWWGYEEDNGYVFNNLPRSESVTLRATADGYDSAEIRATASNPYSYTTRIMLKKK
ncbi:MAG TPA: carboxypeptidase-like regulatory domain-containing protein [Gemmatimonadaceae bacterium]|nr:carboxypeptidase-like regulatory domain-containing protein [Gemmatimonadaceae bacterium]